MNHLLVINSSDTEGCLWLCSHCGQPEFFIPSLEMAFQAVNGHLENVLLLIFVSGL